MPRMERLADFTSSLESRLSARAFVAWTLAGHVSEGDRATRLTHFALSAGDRFTEMMRKAVKRR
jgi:hypothetical protein